MITKTITQNISRKLSIVALLVIAALTTACNGNDSNNDDNQQQRLQSCADTGDCAANPTLQIGGSRAANVHIPSDYSTSTRYPLIVVLHGHGANGALESGYMGFTPRVDDQQFILLTPDGTEHDNGARFWNATEACCAFTEEERQVDDLAYISGLIEEAAATYSIDVDRIGLFGHSNGGFMALRMVCEASELISSVVSLAGSTFAEASSCGPATYPVNVLAIHGDDDDTIPYEGSDAGSFTFPGAEETTERYAALANCDTQNPIATASIDLLSGIDGAETLVTRYSDCDQDVTVELWTILGGSHIPFNYVPESIDSIVEWLKMPRPL